MKMSQKRNEFFQKLWEEYKKNAPLVERIETLLLTREQQIYNDHVAFRTLAFPSCGLDHFTKIFKELGYERRGEYFFEQKKLKACHFECTDDDKAPKIFLSELLVDQLSDKSRKILSRLQQSIPNDLKLDGFFHERPWEADYQDFSVLAEESEYASWFYAHGFQVNHFTVNVNELDTFDSLRELNEFLEEHDVLLNTSGGKVKGGPRDHLEQSSTMADKTWVEFTQGPRLVPSCYYEFARRYEDDSGHLFQGFVTGSADKIFESTHRH